MEGRVDCFLKKQRFRTGEKPKDRKSMALPYHRQKKHPLPESLQERASLKMDSTHHNKSRKATKEPRKSVFGVGVLLFELGCALPRFRVRWLWTFCLLPCPICLQHFCCRSGKASSLDDDTPLKGRDDFIFVRHIVPN